MHVAFDDPSVTCLSGRGVSWTCFFVEVWAEPLAHGLCTMMVDMFRSIADEVVLRCAVTRKL